MNNLQLITEKIRNIENNLDRLIDLQKNPTCGNIKPKERYDDFDTMIKIVDEYGWIDKSLSNYFSARILWQLFMYDSALFFCHQCIECFLKAYLRQNNFNIATKGGASHDLEKLLTHCRTARVNNTGFINNKYITVICKKYNPFYEWGRYPVRKSGPKGKSCGYGSEEIKYIDYFIFNMRSLFKRDIFNYIPTVYMTVRDAPQTLKLFSKDNINCLRIP